ncbi:MAG TPA: hypothetical protein VKP61_16385 [Candidatus Acidoferrum sp.]|nr:hypothetical protein [Candidatus Acidoferrum sp.]
MKEELTEIGRLDLAARAESVEPFLSRAVLPMVFVTMMAFLLALGSQASLSETFAVWMYVSVAAVTVIMLLRHWCYAAYGLSILNFLAAIGILKYSKDDYFHTFLGSTTNEFFLLWFVVNGYSWWRAAAALVAAHDERFDKERSQVGQWLADLKYGDRSGQVIEFSVKSFWNRYRTYRLLNLGNCWAVAKFKSGNLRGLVDYRVRGPDCVTVIEQPNGKMRIEIAGRFIGNVDTSPECRNRLLRSVGKDLNPPRTAGLTNSL